MYICQDVKIFKIFAFVYGALGFRPSSAILFWANALSCFKDVNQVYLTGLYGRFELPQHSNISREKYQADPG